MRKTLRANYADAFVAGFLLVIGIEQLLANDNLRVAYQWNEMDFQYDRKEERLAAVANFEFQPNNVVPFGIEVYRSRLFVTLPRWRDGVPASLAYFNLNDNRTQSPLLIPYPNWAAHSMEDAEPELVSPFRVRADRCGRLWVLDARISDILMNATRYGPAQLLVYDLGNDNLLRRYVLPSDQVKQNSMFVNLAVEDGDCDDTYAYAGDSSSPGLVVYSWKRNDSWRVHHNYFNMDPMAGNFSIGEVEFQWDDGLYGLALSRSQKAASSSAILYFHPLSSTYEFAVNTSILHNKTLIAEGSIHKEFKALGSRGPNAQAGASFLDQLTGVLFYALPNLNAVACWKTSNRAYTIKSQGRVYMSPVEMVFPSDVKVDDQDHLWILSNRLQEFLYGNLSPNSINFRILTAYVKDAIANTACDINTKPLPEIINKLGDILNMAANPTNKSHMESTTSSSVTFTKSLEIFCTISLVVGLRQLI